jgi:hypothetical protein
MNIQNKLKDCVTDAHGMDPHVCLFVCLLYIQSIHTWSKPQDIEFVIINYIR